MSGQHDTAQICLNGHVINESFHRYPQFSQECCDKCGSKTIFQCEHCQTEIRGHYFAPGIVSAGGMDAPNYCHKCGKPYPWTTKKLSAFMEMAEELDELSPEEKAKLKSSLDDIISETPKTEVASFRVKKVLSKLGKDTYGAVRDILVDVASETAKKALFGK